MLPVDEKFTEVYTKFKLHFYRDVFGRFGHREATLTTVESFCMEVIYAMKHPTINEFASFIRISSPNAAYKVNCLIKKGYVRKIQSKKDRREYYLEVTQRYIDYYNISEVYQEKVMKRLHDRITPEEMQTLEHILTLMSEELMDDVPRYRYEEEIETADEEQ